MGYLIFDGHINITSVRIFTTKESLRKCIEDTFEESVIPLSAGIESYIRLTFGLASSSMYEIQIDQNGSIMNTLAPRKLRLLEIISLISE